MRYHLVVIAPTAAEVVRCAGGWVFDRTCAGWQVTALIAECSNVRPLGILGATVLDLEQALTVLERDMHPNAIAVASQTYLSDDRVRAGVHEYLDSRPVEVALWGDGLPSELDDRVEPVSHRMSNAARVFKNCALAAAGFPEESAAEIEAFRTRELPPPSCRYDGDLVSAR
ncbi:hypothetical protein [Nocardia macrotermitis]|uniref:hypothetical protein n=1 Tax=Nocardia macrotermitis TaxID=2585198 RepID=UPI00387359DC